jgi:hypothetical protein
VLIAQSGRSAYPPIDDWSLDARAALVRERGGEIRLLLDEAFTIFGEEIGLPFGAFGFDGDDPIDEAVEWCLAAFASRDIDPSRLDTQTWRLFTDVRWWLAQKVGLPAYRRVWAEHLAASGRSRDRMRAEPAADPDRVPAPGTECGEVGASPEWLRRELGRTLETLARRTCADLVAYWLVGTEGLRRDWFGWSDPAPAARGLASGKQRSFRTADALFRFLAIHATLVRDEAADVEHRACVLAWFSGCPNQPPYRAPDAAIAPRLRLTPSAVAAPRRGGLRALLVACVALRTRDGTDADARVLAELARRSLRRVLPDVFKLEDDRALKELFCFEEPIE